MKFENIKQDTELEIEKRSLWQRKRLYFLLLLFSLLIHFIFLDYFFNFGLRKRCLNAFNPTTTTKKNKTIVLFDTPPNAKLIPKLPDIKSKAEPIELKKTEISSKKPIEKPKEDSELPASLKPRKSEFGFPNMQDEFPEPNELTETKLGTIDEHEDLEAEANVKDISTVKVEEIKRPEAEDTTQKTVPAEPKPQIKIAEKVSATILSADEKAARIQEIISHQKMLEQFHSRKVEEKINPKLFSQTAQADEAKPKSYLHSSEDKIEMRFPGLKKKTPQPQKRNLIAMTKGFIENLKNEGNDWLERKGDDSKRPSFEELKYISYEEKVTWCMQASWKQSFEYSPLHELHTNEEAVVDFSIDENGNLVSCDLLQSTGNKPLDDMIMKNMKLASPYPPLPKHFETKLYRTGRIIHVYPKRLGF
jgi:TonB family protein